MMNEFDRCIDEWAELVAKRNATITALEQRVKELETNMLAATATVASLENRLADVERERDNWRDSVHLIAGKEANLLDALIEAKHSRDQAREALRNHEELYLAARRYVAIAQSNKSPYIRENGQHGGSPWSELVDAVNDWTGHASPRIDVGGET